MLTIDRYIIIKFLIYFNFLFPTFDSIFRDTGFAAGFVIIHFIIMVTSILAILIWPFQVSTPLYLSGLFFCGFFLLIAISILFSTNEIIFRDLFELHRPFFYGSAFILPLIMVWNHELIKKYFVNPIIICFVIQIIMGLLTTLDFAIIDMIRSLYTKAHNVRTGRATGTFRNPYDFGVMIVMIVIFFTHLSLLAKKIWIKTVYLFCSVLSIYSIFLSQSRTAIIVLLCALLYYSILMLFRTQTFEKSIKILGVLIITSIVGYYLKDSFMHFVNSNFNYLYYGIEKLLNEGISGTNSTRERFRQLFWAWAEISKSPVFGLGPSKNVQEYLEMQYSLYLYRYGLIGISIVLIYLIFSYFTTKKTEKNIVKNTNDPKLKAFFISLHVWCAVLVVSSFGNAFIDMPRISFFFFLSMGLCTALIYKKESFKNLI